MQGRCHFFRQKALEVLSGMSCNNAEHWWGKKYQKMCLDREVETSR